ncbi:flagellar basal-body rod protein FlgF [Arsenicitalea aurantiaca]|uniref:Flagellar basal-body rod protein FlgF n=1 Tax=Arsenicitalea aurantiaca TaxID=1783274 RepID=A0A433XGB5_9HYPH|nr:flagellar basal-body rod protein FlgF [Arsenicitalea aurantiaca]RUT33125.1 flagellar basal-body rod protein FlgF [Arsenicitalea aurantiaca]
MENAHLIGLSRQIALQRQMDVVANNVANINTDGFKAQALLFEEYEMPVARHRGFAGTDQMLSFTQDWATLHDMSGGARVQTGNPLDVALSDGGFLVVETPAGERYTRSGALQINAEGTLVTADGNPVLGDGGPIQFGPEETDIVFAQNGAISSSAGAKGRLQIVAFEDVQALTREGATLFAGGTPQPATGVTLTQGAIERSNVSGVAEMARMIRVSRAYQSLASLMQKQDDLRRSAIQRLGDMQA